MIQLGLQRNISVLISVFSAVIFFGIWSDAQAGLIVKAPPYIGLNEGLVGHWSFDGPDMNKLQALDRSGNANNGTLTNGPKRAIGKIGQALDFDGGDDCIYTVSNTNIDNLSSITVSAWINPRTYGERGNGSFDDIGRIVSKSGTSGWIFGLNSGKAEFYRSHVTISLNALSTASSIALNQWQHVAMTWTGGTTRASVEFYVNGANVGRDAGGSDAIGAYNGDASAQFALGDDVGINCATPGYLFNGLIDDVRIYNRALTEQEIKRLYKIGSTFVVNKPRTDTLKEGLVGHWSFDGPDMSQSTNNVWALDRSGNNNNGRLANTATSSVRKAGKIGQALNFDGVDDEVAADDSASLDITGPMTISVWFKLTGTAGEYAGPIIKTQAGNEGYGIFFTNDVFVGSTDSIAFYVTDYATNAGYKSFSYGTDREWHHAVGVYNGANVQIYVDGIKGTDDTFTGAVTMNANQLRIGNFTGGFGPAFPGLIDDVRIYNRALTEQEIKRLYKIGSTFVVNKPRTDTLKEGLVGHWSFDGPDMSQSTNNVWSLDRSGQGNNGRLANTATSTARVVGKIGQGLEFDGVDDYIGMGDVLDFNDTDDFTFTAWFYRDIIGTDDVIIAKSNGGAAIGYILDIRSSDDAIRLSVSDGTDTYILRSTAPTIFTSPGWHHVAAIWDDASAENSEIYIDGSDANVTDTGTIGNVDSLANTDEFRIGVQPDLDDPFDGKIDEVRVYNRALTEQEIKRLYNMGR